MNRIITLYTMNWSNAAIESQINNAIDVLSKNLYLTIAVAARNFDILIQTL